MWIVQLKYKKSLDQVAWIALMLVGIAGSARAETLASQSTPPAGMACISYLHFNPAIKKNSPIILDILGSGIYERRSDRFIGAAQYLYNKNKAFVVTYDKPGIAGKDQLPADAAILDPKNFSFDEEKFFKHTQKDLIRCAGEALEWALDQKAIVGEGNRIVLLGGSEGAQIELRLVHNYLKSGNKKVLDRIASVNLWGELMSSWQDLTRFQNPKSKADELFAAVVKEDAGYFKKQDPSGKYEHNTGLAYYEDIFATPTICEDLTRMLSIGLGDMPVHFYHGLNDIDVPVEPVKQCETLYEKAKKVNSMPRSNLEFSYFLTDHYPNWSANNSILRAIEFDL